MTVQIQKAYQYYQGPILANTELPIIEFTFIDNSHVSAKIRNNNELWQYGIDYTVSGAGTTERKITILKEVLATEILAVYLDVPITQMVVPEEGGLFPAATQEFTLDKLTYICQMLQERITRSLQISVDTEFNGTLPELLPNRTFKVNALGTGLILSEYDPDQAIVVTEDFKTAAEVAAAAAKESETNAKTSEVNTKISETATEQIKQDTEQIKQDTEQIKQDTEQIKQDAEQIKQATQAIADKALQDIGTAKTDAISEVSNTKDSAIQVINTEETSVISNIQTEGAKSIQLAKDWATKMDGKVNDEDYSSKYYAEQAKQAALITGQIAEPIITLSNTLGKNEIWLEGAEISRTTYAALFEIYGTTYGEGDGSTTFNLPDFRNRTLWGAEDFGYIEAGLPNITGSTTGQPRVGKDRGCFYSYDSTLTRMSQSSNSQYSDTLGFNASRSSSIYGNSTTVQPPSVKVRVKTRYA